MSSNKSDASEKEEALIEKVAKKIVDSEWEAPAITLLQLIKPLAGIGGELGYFYLAPFLPLLDNYGYDFLDTFEKRENLEKLTRRIEKLYKEREAEKKSQRQSLSSRLRKFFSKHD